MIQETKNLKAEIISALDFLPADNLKLLAKFVAFLQTNTAQDAIEKADIPQTAIRLTSPRLARREQVADFEKEVVWETKE